MTFILELLASIFDMVIQILDVSGVESATEIENPFKKMLNK